MVNVHILVLEVPEISQTCLTHNHNTELYSRLARCKYSITLAQSVTPLIDSYSTNPRNSSLTTVLPSTKRTQKDSCSLVDLSVVSPTVMVLYWHDQHSSKSSFFTRLVQIPMMNQFNLDILRSAFVIILGVV